MRAALARLCRSLGMAIIAVMSLPKSCIQPLRSHSLFSALEDEQFAHVIERASCLQLMPDEHLFHAGQAAEQFFLVLSGQMKLYRLAPTGAEKVIEIIRPQQTFAEALMFLELPSYPVEAQALGAVALVALPNRPYLEVLAQSPQTSFHVMAGLSVRLKQLLGEIDALTLQNATLRVVNYLLYLLPEGMGRGESARITLPAAKQVIASRLSVQPETFSRILSSLSAKGLISVEGLAIQIHDLPALRLYNV